MTKSQIKKARQMIVEGRHTIGAIYKALYGSDAREDCTCEDSTRCSCLVGSRILQITMLQIERS